MTIWCKVEGGVITTRVNVRKPPKGIAIVGGEPVWREYFPAPRPSYNDTTHHAPVSSESIQPTQVLQVWTTPIAKTQQELDDEVTAAQDSALSRTDRPNSIERALMVAQYRQIKGTTPAGVADTPAAFRQYLRGLM